MKVGVFDSGVGGLSVVKAIEKAFPEVEVVYKEDKKNVPYGDKTTDELKFLVLPIMEQFVAEGCDILVIACNTVTTNLADYIRQRISVPIIGLEPMVKPAAEITKTKTIAVCATPATLSSERYAWLKDEYAKGVQVLEPDCSDWASMIEADAVQHDKIASRMQAMCEMGADVIVLGCTHYHWIQEQVESVANKYGASVIQPEEAIVSRLKTVLAQLA